MADVAFRDDIVEQVRQRIRAQWPGFTVTGLETVVDIVLDLIDWSDPEPLCPICGNECRVCVISDEEPLYGLAGLITGARRPYPPLPR